MMSQTNRNRIGFWILGLCNNYSYVVMLSAAFDILSGSKPKMKIDPDDNQETPICNPMSTGAILVADIVPALTIKLISPVLPLGTNIRVILVIGLALASFIIVSLSTTTWISFLGVAFASLSSGLGEATFLIFSSLFADTKTIAFWSSGTGGAGVLAAISYASLTSSLIGFSPHTTLLVMTIIPVIMALTFWILIKVPTMENSSTENSLAPISPPFGLEGDIRYETIQVHSPSDHLTLSEKLNLMKSLWRFMLPLTLVYYAEYIINQCFFELLYFPKIWLNHKEQYRWYQVDYQIGVLVSRSSISCIRIKYLWVLSLLQGLNVVLVLVQVLTNFIPFIWFILLLVFWEGLLGGAAYVNTFDQVYRKFDDRHRGFCLGATSLADSLGIAISGFSSIYFHNLLCDLLNR
ncbi:CLN3 lysosomal/endosomal transmembrane protein, battenin isoform X2 [Brevipalpus obovatus]|uniref:CLN3 lysosomal/endosomal transmembrane protein, battenin isoform X2 n=1 Tax=Brevipalpus obovatus TaxID=246614 RepID=UPI003D9F0B28